MAQLKTNRTKAMRFEQLSQILQAHRDELHDFGVEKISVFGSIARNSATEKSDIDMVVELRDITYRGYITLKKFLEKTLQRKVDLVTSDAVTGRFKDEISKDLRDVATF
jgi:hypothetical protein